MNEVLLRSRYKTSAPPRITLNAFLLDTGNHRILIDTGIGAFAGEGGAGLMDNLNAIGLDASAIDTVLITLMHPDHVGGLIDADDQPVFPKARVLVPAGELDYWRGDIPQGAPEVLIKQFQAAHRVIAGVGSRMQRLAGTEVLPGITRVPLPGHTPDHSGYRIVSGEDRILIWTDIVHLPGIQFPRPEATVAFDVDPPQAATTRRHIMAELAKSRELVAGHHLDFPGIGYVAEDGDGFRFLPHVWRPTV
ncbi:MBL fold metallo-hydrolase [Halospina sp. K52047b]|uniref:MBL fold metallo-hydrolase n=1 Tax=Halospina sp. K52047b TaxID=2614160 RepID=UPI001788123C|nr:MBL fold metallo-hydrolase [Halospina sp. K52047b]